MNIIADQGFNLFDKFASRCVYLSLEEEGCTLSSWGDNKTYTTGSLANSQRILAEINESKAVAKTTIWMEVDAVKHLKFHFLSFLSYPTIFCCLGIQRIFFT